MPKPTLIYSPNDYESAAMFVRKIGRRIAKFRVENGITQKEFCLDIGCYNQPTIACKEHSKYNEFNLRDLYLICNAYNLPLDYFFKD